jgi:hypothetical protein
LYNILAKRRLVQKQVFKHTNKKKEITSTIVAQTYKITSNSEQITYLLRIYKKEVDKNNKIIKESEREYITNYPHKIDFYRLRLDHWQVESFHKVKDVWLTEDRYHKGQHNAKVLSVMNNFVIQAYQIFNVKAANKLTAFYKDIEDALVFFILFVFSSKFYDKNSVF